MILIYGLIIIYVILLILPLLGGLISYLKDKAQPIHIDQTRIKDPRYFAKSFTRLFNEKWENYDRKSDLFFSKNEKVILADETEIFEEECNGIVVAERHDFIPNQNINFNKEIMSLNHAYVYGDIQLRALKSQKDCVLGKGINVVRWVDAEGYLLVHDHCNLGLSASSASVLTVGKNVNFMRLYAPIINLGMTKIVPHGHSSYKYALVPSLVRKHEHDINDSMVDENRIANFSVVSKKEVLIHENITLQGHIHSDKGIRIQDNSFIGGNVFANRDIYVGKNVVILGNVFTHGNIYCEDGVTIGQEHHTSSIVAGGRIDFSLNSMVYGYVHSEEGGVVYKLSISDDDIRNEVANEERRYGISEEDKLHHVAHTMNEYNYEHPVGFRYDLSLTEVIIPEGVEFIRRSMFFGCKNLVKVVIPKSVRVIEDYAFFGCESLKEIEFESSIHIQSIGKSAFENCTSLENFVLPEFVRKIESSTFSNCRNLKNITIHKDAYLDTIDSHAFKDCVSLEQFICPDFVSSLGKSVFYGCINLKEIHLPKALLCLGDYAFYQCDQVNSKNISKEILNLMKKSKGNPDWAEEVNYA